MFARVHAHLHVRFNPGFCTCRCVFMCSICICECTHARGHRLYITYTQHTRIIEGGARCRCACIRARIRHTRFRTRLDVRSARMRVCMRICSSPTILYHIYATQMLHMDDVYSRACMRIYIYASFDDFTCAVIRLGVVCVYAHAHAQEDVAYM